MLRISTRFCACFDRSPGKFVLLAVVTIALCYAFGNVARDAVIDGVYAQLRINESLRDILRTSKYYQRNPIKPPYKDKFWESGQRSRNLTRWITDLDGPLGSELREKEKEMLLAAIETTASSLFPFLNPAPGEKGSETPLSDLRRSFTKGSRGIVIPAGGSESQIRFTGHLISTLRDVLGCSLPIQLAYAGDGDLPEYRRDALLSLDKTNNTELLNVWTVLDDTILRLRRKGWAIKAFAALASKFEHVILVDADAVFLQSPEVLFQQRAYVDNGAYLFHDRLLWQHSFQDRHEWWKDQIKEPSPAMNKSLVWTEDYAEECDSGVVVLDKSRTEVLVGLLHISWQNTNDVRDEVSYQITYGDKETWWLGLELAGSRYEFEKHYGSIVGWEKEDDADAKAVCSFVIAHPDEEDKLLWYNGSLLKNKLADPDGYEVPLYWMMDGEWEKGGKKDMSCMVKGERRWLSGDEISTLQMSIDAAIRADEALARAEAEFQAKAKADDVVDEDA
ncbi:glycosyltransferase family 71 protein [Trichoderma citrinoviride]|uniref:Glycosyltransferase family 71 protein n=1 Tax=Trichoderma citrinoviride TaxID=58853 RepID=A0A2T4BEN7_9HYPO|nr:glycosyltransferase family 71 protein [Trichoderma citrinoviride]PTB67804.1 glycosyltransferase family 71 protein [Trichoderma citrinoviride]